MKIDTGGGSYSVKDSDCRDASNGGLSFLQKKQLRHMYVGQDVEEKVMTSRNLFPFSTP
jgi:hypothetical protein